MGADIQISEKIMNKLGGN